MSKFYISPICISIALCFSSPAAQSQSQNIKNYISEYELRQMASQIHDATIDAEKVADMIVHFTPTKTPNTEIPNAKLRQIFGVTEHLRGDPLYSEQKIVIPPYVIARKIEAGEKVIMFLMKHPNIENAYYPFEIRPAK